MQKPDLTCWQGWETNPRPAELVSQAHCTVAPTAIAVWATEAGTVLRSCCVKIHTYADEYTVRRIKGVTTYCSFVKDRQSLMSFYSIAYLTKKSMIQMTHSHPPHTINMRHFVKFLILKLHLWQTYVVLACFYGQLCITLVSAIKRAQNMCLSRKWCKATTIKRSVKPSVHLK